MLIKRVSRLLGERRESVHQLSRETGISYEAAYSLYKGKTKRIELETLNRLCEHFGVTPNDILQYVPDQTQDTHPH